LEGLELFEDIEEIGKIFLWLLGILLRPAVLPFDESLFPFACDGCSNCNTGLHHDAMLHLSAVLHCGEVGHEHSSRNLYRNLGLVCGAN
jgi:hypothetical protein